MREKYFFYNSSSSDYTPVIQTTCGSLQSKICGGRAFSPFSDFWSRISSTFRIGTVSEKHWNSWVSVRAACPGVQAGGWSQQAPCQQLQHCAHAESQLCRDSTSCSFPWAWGIPSQENQSTLSSLSCWGNTRVLSALGMVSQSFHPVLTQNMLQS